MVNWGYSINKDNQIDFDKNTKEIVMKLIEQEPSYSTCIACGSCTGTCSAGNFTNFSLRKINTLVSRGELTGLSEEIKKCMLCGKCILVCPRGVNTRNVLLVLKELMN
jgi:heterodisulfide reductase subunit C